MRARIISIQSGQDVESPVENPDHDILASRITSELYQVGQFAGYTNEEVLSLLMPLSFYPGSGQLRRFIKWTELFYLKENLGWPVREIIEEDRKNGGPVW